MPQDRITFKREPRETGLSAIGSPHSNTKIRVMVNKDCPDDNPNCSWKWVFFKNRFDSEEVARAWFLKVFDQIKQKYNVRSLEGDY